MDFQKLLNSTEYDFNRRYETGEQGGIKLYIDDLRKRSMGYR